MKINEQRTSEIQHPCQWISGYQEGEEKEGGAQKATKRLSEENFPNGKRHKSTDSKGKLIRNKIK